MPRAFCRGGAKPNGPGGQRTAGRGRKNRGGIAIANKTGEIDGVRNDVAIVDPAGEIPYILVVLTKGLRNEGAGNAGIAAISRRVYTRLHAAS